MPVQEMQAQSALLQIHSGAVCAANLTVARLRSVFYSRLSFLPSARRSISLNCEPQYAKYLCTSAAMDRTVKTSTRVIEHIVLLKSKERAPTEQQDAMVSGLRSLKSLPMVIELNAGKVAHASSEGYTHALHCRYRSKDDLASYANDPYHLDVINKCIVPIVEDRLALDWEADVEEPVLQSGSYGAVRILTMKPKQELANSEIEGTIDALKEYTSKFSFVKQVSAGKNFSPARAKGYEWAYLAMFPSTKELAELINSDGYKGLHSKVSSIMEKFNIVDYHTA